uniref:PKS-NRPS hybrid synthetase cheA-like n=1 Tax=Erigeron canadensis TaxID=72917 RepID=UPI001CB9D171|nr:PKS-NRPS hybrid synthetase cheA-like [Erigeron canadensis]
MTTTNHHHVSSNHPMEDNKFVMITPEFFTNKVFSSREELMNWVKDVAYSVGVVVVTKRSNSYLSGFVYKVVLMCDHGGKYKQKGSIRAPRTRKTDCLFELETKYSDEYNYWTLTVICYGHNHRPLQSSEGHPYAQRLTQDEFSLVEELTAMNMPPRDISSRIREKNLGNVSTISTIYNACTKLRMVEQVLMAILHSNNYVYEFSTTASNELENLFFVHQTSFNIWRAFPHVLIIDAMYKTNYYNLPLVEIVGVTSTNKTFSIAFAFIQKEKTANYTWVLNCLKLTLDSCMYSRVIVIDRELVLVNACKEIFPDAAQLLCRIHISRNIFDHCRQTIKSTRDWCNFNAL